MAVLLWAAFAVVVVASAALLLPACGLLPVGWNFCPVGSAALAAEAQHSDVLRSQADELKREIARRQMACASRSKPPPQPLELPQQAGPPRPQQTALLKPPPPPPPKAPLDVDRWNNKDVSLLEGCWQLGRETGAQLNTGSGSEQCRMLTGKICFSADGRGQRDMAIVCPTGGSMTCHAPVTGTFEGGGVLDVRQPDTKCSNGRTTWSGPGSSLKCRRVSDTLAICRDAVNFEHEFRR